jgi:hypothetical protein
VSRPLLHVSRGRVPVPYPLVGTGVGRWPCDIRVTP